MRPPRAQAGFTLAEVAVTLVIVSATLVLVLQGLNTSKITAAHSHNRKVARELALVTLGEVQAGLLWEDLDGEMGSFSGTYAEQGYEAFFWEVFVGEDLPSDEDYGEEGGYFDSYEYRRDLEEEEELEEEDSAFGSGSTGGTYERVTVRVVYPKFGDLPNEFTIERWIPLEQVYGVDPNAEREEEAEGFGG